MLTRSSPTKTKSSPSRSKRVTFTLNSPTEAEDLNLFYENIITSQKHSELSNKQISFQPITETPFSNNIIESIPSDKLPSPPNISLDFHPPSDYSDEPSVRIGLPSENLASIADLVPTSTILPKNNDFTLPSLTILSQDFSEIKYPNNSQQIHLPEEDSCFGWCLPTMGCLGKLSKILNKIDFGCMSISVA